MQKPLSTSKLIRTAALQKWQDLQNYVKSPTWNVMLQLQYLK